MKFIITLLTFQTFNLIAQVSQEWVSRYNGLDNGNDGGISIAVDSSGNVYVTGQSTGFFTNHDYVTIKYNSAGVQQWVQRYNGTGNNVDYASSIAVDLSGNVYVTGFSTGIGTFYDYATIKYNASGDSVWVRRYNGPGIRNDLTSSIAVDLSGNVYVTGWSAGSGTFDDYATVKYNSAGVQQWVQRYNGTGNNVDVAYSLAVDGSGNVYVTGWSVGKGTSYDYATIKYNTAGIEQWVRRYNGPGGNGYDEDEAYSIAVDGSGNVYVTGRSFVSGTSFDYATIKYNSLGVQQWVARYNGSGNSHDVANSIAVDGSGNVYVTGLSIGSGTSGDYTTVKYNSAGVQQWVQRYNEPGSGVDHAHSITLDGSGNVYITGGSMGSQTGRYDYATVKYNSVGVQLWVQRYNGPGNVEDRAFSIVVDGASNVYVTGESFGSGTSDYATIKYSQTIGIQPISNEIPNQFSLSQNYPNPFNPSTKIQFSFPHMVLSPLYERGAGGFVKLIIFDLLGREVATLVNEQLQPGTYAVDFDGTNYSSGIYYYKLNVMLSLPEQTGGVEAYNETRKMVLIK